MSEPLSPTGYYRYLLDQYQGTAKVNLDLDEDEPYDPAADAPWTVINTIELPPDPCSCSCVNCSGCTA